MKKLIALTFCVFAMSAIANEEAATTTTTTENSTMVIKKNKKPAKAKKPAAEAKTEATKEEAKPADEHGNAPAAPADTTTHTEEHKAPAHK